MRKIDRFGIAVVINDNDLNSSKWELSTDSVPEDGEYSCAE